MKKDSLFDIVLSILMFITSILLIAFIVSYFFTDFKIDNGIDYSTAIVIDKFTTSSRFGSPHYYLIYKLVDGTVINQEVDANGYYNTDIIE